MPSIAPRSTLRRALRATALAASLAMAGTAHATPDAGAAAEIDQLLAAVGHSACTFIRSGKEYDAEEARKHLLMKYRFARSRIDSAEQFVRDLASASSVTGEPYQVRCSGVQSAARPWMEAQLRAVRSRR